MVERSFDQGLKEALIRVEGSLEEGSKEGLIRG